MLTWLKKDNNSNLLGGATFQVCRTEDSSGTTLSPAECVTVVDNTGQSGYSGLDADPVAGQFKLTSLPPVTTAALGTADLPLGTYTIQETVAPSGFAVDPSVQTVVLTLTSLNSAAANAFVDTPIFFGNMYPTTTTCAQFNSGAPTETSGTYKLKSGVINSVSPGVIFYYTKFKAASSNVDIRQVVSQSVSSYLVAPQQINVYDANCNTVASNVRFTSVNSSGTQDITSLAVTLTPGNTYIIGVKYSVSSITGPAPNPATLTYNFATYDANKTTLLDRAPIPSFTLTKG
jgi:hypothetical protein